MNIAVYARKSKLTDKGESIENQIKICMEYAKIHFNNTDKYKLMIYKDEGYSGGNILRPQFQNLINDLKTKKFDILICYKLDRISRNISDFSLFIQELEKLNIGFVSVKEQFDTSIPIGRAMMYIASVFSQLERETISERITDNFTSLASTGRYLAWKAPEGYEKKQIKYTDENGIIKKYNVLDINYEEANRIKLIFEKYLQWQSINKVQSYCIENNIKNRNNNIYKCVSIKRILTHPDYMSADIKAYEYFNNIGSKIVSQKNKFNGNYGISVLRRTSKKNNKIYYNTPNEWIISVGYHKGIIKSEDWISAQETLIKRKKSLIKHKNGKTGLLSGLLKCKNCGEYMRPFSVSKEGKFYYICINKEISKKKLCNNKNIRGDLLDKEIINHIKNFLYDKNELLNELFNIEKNLKNKNLEIDLNINYINKKINSNKNALQNLIIKLSETNNKTVTKYISEQIENLDKQNENLKNDLNKILYKDKNINNNTEYIKNKINTIKYNFLINDITENNDIIKKRTILKTIINSIDWNGKYIEINYKNL